jgi:peptide/nickel transport system ATP-binding protein
MGILELQDVVVRYGTGRDSVVAVNRVSLTVEIGKTLGLVGESGSGKSSLAKALVGLVPIESGHMEFGGVDHSSEKARESANFRRRMQMVFQDPYSSLNPRMSIGQMLSEAVGISRRADSRKSRLAIAGAMLERVGLDKDMLARYRHQFSGGQLQRVAIARALCVDPEMIILDEPTSALDVSIQGAILNLLQDLQQQFGLTYIFMSHDLGVVRHVSDSVAVMYLGRIIETATAEDLFTQPAHPYSQALTASIPALGAPPVSAPVLGEPPDPRNPPRGCSFHPRCPVGPLSMPERGICLESDPQVLAKTRVHLAACHFAPMAHETPPADVGGQEGVGGQEYVPLPGSS